MPGRVPAPNDAFRETLGRGREHEVLAHDLEHRGLHQQDRARRANQDEGEHRESRVVSKVYELKEWVARPQAGNERNVLCGLLGITEAMEREPVERECEEPKENQSDPEGRHVVEK